MDGQGYLDYLRQYLREIASIATESASLVVGAIWGIFQSHLQGFWYTSALFWLAIFWAIDFCLGSGRALHAREWSPRRALMSGAKLATGCLVLMVAHATRESLLGGKAISTAVASLLDAVVLLAEFSSVLIHAGTISKSRIVLRIGLSFRRGSNRAADKVIALIDGKRKKEEEKDGSEPEL